MTPEQFDELAEQTGRHAAEIRELEYRLRQARLSTVIATSFVIALACFIFYFAARGN